MWPRTEFGGRWHAPAQPCPATFSALHQALIRRHGNESGCVRPLSIKRRADQRKDNDRAYRPENSDHRFTLRWIVSKSHDHQFTTFGRSGKTTACRLFQEVWFRISVGRTTRSAVPALRASANTTGSATITTEQCCRGLQIQSVRPVLKVARTSRLEKTPTLLL